MLTATFHLIERETTQPVDDQRFVVTISGEDGSMSYDVESVDGIVTLQVPLPEGDSFSVTATIRKDAHNLETALL